jgi:hypothetical protein
MNSVDQLFGKLQALGAGEFAHLNGPLSTHLRGTEALLREWGAPEPVCAAGLYHAVYGTDGYNPALTSLAGRKHIAELIGDEAESLAYLFGACNRTVFYPRIGTDAQRMFADRFTRAEYEISLRQLAELCEITLANEMEIASNSPEFKALHGRYLSQLFERMSGLVSKAAFRAFRTVLPPIPSLQVQWVQRGR